MRDLSYYSTYIVIVLIAHHILEIDRYLFKYVHDYYFKTTQTLLSKINISFSLKITFDMYEIGIFSQGYQGGILNKKFKCFVKNLTD